jgi:hypothetical protein
MKYKHGITYQFTNGSNVYACITNPLFLGLYTPCKKKGDTWGPPKIRVKVEQNRLLIISLQECTQIKLCEK